MSVEAAILIGIFCFVSFLVWAALHHAFFALTVVGIASIAVALTTLWFHPPAILPIEIDTWHAMGGFALAMGFICGIGCADMLWFSKPKNSRDSRDDDIH